MSDNAKIEFAVQTAADLLNATAREVGGGNAAKDQEVFLRMGMTVLIRCIGEGLDSASKAVRQTEAVIEVLQRATEEAFWIKVLKPSAN